MKSLADLDLIREKMKEEVEIRTNHEYKTDKKHVLVCGGTGCTSSGSQKIIDILNDEIKKAG